VLAAAGYNFSLLLRWFEELLRALSLILWHALLAAPLHLTRWRKTFFTADDSTGLKLVPQSPVHGHLLSARARSVAAPIANRGPQKSSGGDRKCSQLFPVEHEGLGPSTARKSKSMAANNKTALPAT